MPLARACRSLFMPAGAFAFLAVLSFQAALLADASAALNPTDSAWKMICKAEGISAQDANDARLVFDKHCHWLHAKRPQSWAAWHYERRSQWALETLHERLLTGCYEPSQDSVMVALRTGNYNCVSATILFHIVAEELHLPVSAVQIRGHVWSRVLASQVIDIESTCEDWFELANWQRETSPSAKAGGSTRVLSFAGLVAKIPYNRATVAASKGDYAYSLEQLDLALLLDPADAAATKNRKLIQQDYSVHCLLPKKGDQVVKLFQDRVFADSVDTVRPTKEVAEQLILRWCQAGRFADAVTLRQSMSSEIASATVEEIYHDWLKVAIREGKATRARNVLRSALVDLQGDQAAMSRLRIEFRAYLDGS